MTREKILLISDLHLTDKKEDSYRFGIFDLVEEIAEQGDTELSTLVILGDITDAKDKHRATFVNNVVDRIDSLADFFKDVIILYGNHDGLESTSAYFKFAEKLSSNIQFITEPTYLKFSHSGSTSLEDLSVFLPNTRTPLKDWNTLFEDLAQKKFSLIFTHQAYAGSMTENGMELGEGVPPAFFSFLGLEYDHVFSGDIHVPQKVNEKVTYIGSPYHIHFGDKYNPRILQIQLENGRLVDQTSIWTDDYFPYRHMIEVNSLQEFYEYELNENDQVKVRLKLPPEELVDWQRYKNEIKQSCKDRNVELFGVELKEKYVKKQTQESDEDVEDKETSLMESTDSEVISRFAEQESLASEVVSKGKEILDED